MYEEDGQIVDPRNRFKTISKMQTKQSSVPSVKLMDPYTEIRFNAPGSSVV